MLRRSYSQEPHICRILEAVLQDSALASLVLVVAVLGIVVHAVLTRSVFGAPATQSVLKVFQTLINRNINDYLI